MSNFPRPTVLAIMDGWGIAPASPGNATTLAKTPNLDTLRTNYLHTQLIAHGESVGLPKREPGNTETGHKNLGAGHIVYQDLPRINISIADGSFFQNQALLDAAKHVSQNKSRLHLMGLVGGGGVHSDLSHFTALLRFCHEQLLKDVFIHVFTDGRDSPPQSAMEYINQLQTSMGREGVGVIASVSGRYYAMDRDFRWDRTAKTYFCLTEGQGKQAKSIADAVSQAYAQNQTDEFIAPTNIVDTANKPLALISDNDAVVFVNFRIDRPRQLTKAFVLTDFKNQANKTGFDPFSIKYSGKHDTSDKEQSRQEPFDRPRQLQNLFFVTMTEYEKDLPVHVAYPPQSVPDPIGKVIADHNLKQLHCAESEKERFVTYYFNGLRDKPFPGEDRLIVPSPKVPTYDKQPEMSSRELTNQVITNIQSGKYDFIVMNYACPDMVGHTGNIKAAVKACETVDACLLDLSQAILSVGGALAITADHGNVEEMINVANNTVDTEHNANPVPFIIVGEAFKTGKQLPQGILADVAPTVLSIMKIPIPIEMTGRNLLGDL